MSIKPPMCKQCGHTHWGLEHVWEGKQATHPLATIPMLKMMEDVRKESRTVPRTVAPSKLAAAQAEIEALQAEVRMLKRKLAEATLPVTRNETINVTENVTGNTRGRPKTGKALSSAERVRKLRAARKTAR